MELREVSLNDESATFSDKLNASGFCEETVSTSN